MLQDEKLGDSIHQVEELIRKHEDFEKTIEAQEEKCAALKRVTLVSCLRFVPGNLTSTKIFKPRISSWRKHL